jgi:hypothetical protein
VCSPAYSGVVPKGNDGLEAVHTLVSRLEDEVAELRREVRELRAVTGEEMLDLRARTHNFGGRLDVFERRIRHLIDAREDGRSTAPKPSGTADVS